ncbi:Invasion gene expression up-regulator, SirB [Serratia entomophila]|uniref:SirB2 family protein n=1 Tax=Serratia entomophila TaxID=42906 RepID=UPI002177EBEA|nr:SirB2 family protein [Serratia entomophila]CAI0848854.1 Invasion gene expression up-regulator, SirB [Serratia entomophila]CAI1511104.1 Invasion gene expression up-regulator, SirB [Serratia entomophila]CAI1682657.1 Invasion gene expression up-regulator, SirB [Serratia entomophila]CAI1857442.1 Invasion gene expression up-regulator, SirB [Serratia entomophila]CAI2028400.1 Invasion gene expression up-regulator, SirB [Serratia entomophila]
MTAYTALKQFHLLTVAISITLFVLRFFWQWRKSAIMNQRWIKIAPHLNDTLLFVSGIALVATFGLYPLLGMDSWLTEKLFGVIIYILLGYVALGKKTKSRKLRVTAFVLALGGLYLIIKLATTKIPFLMGYL